MDVFLFLRFIMSWEVCGFGGLWEDGEGARRGRWISD